MPSGSRRVYPNADGPRSMCSPASPTASPAKYSKHSAPEITSTTDVSWIGLPVSRVSSRARSSFCARSRSATRLHGRARAVSRPARALPGRATALDLGRPATDLARPRRRRVDLSTVAARRIDRAPPM
jgi:hypothetical protein